MKTGVERMTIPLLHDNHNHLSLYAALSGALDISSMGPIAAIDAIKALPSDGLSLVKGWRTSSLRLAPTDLAALPPVLIVNISLHGFAVSDAGMGLLSSRMPELADRASDADWCEAHVPEVFAAYCDIGGVDSGRLEAELELAVSLGIGSADDMAVADSKSIDAYMKIDTKKACNLFVGPIMYEKLTMPRREVVKGIKFFVDGSIGSRSAAIQGTWIGGGKPILNHDTLSLTEGLRRAGEAGIGASIHAIGETAIRIALDAVDAADRGGRSPSEIRLEHAQFIDAMQARRAKDLGVILSMQPNFSTDSLDYADRLPSGYPERNNPFRMLIDEVGFVPGVDLIFGSDGMPTGIAYAAQASLFPEAPGQRLTLDELIAGYGPSRLAKGSIALAIDRDARKVSVDSGRA